MRTPKLIGLVLLLALSGCKANEAVEVMATEPPKVMPQVQYIKSEYNLYFVKDDYMLSLYEPPKGRYVGAYVLANKEIDYDMSKFDQQTQKQHPMYMYNMKLGEDFPEKWVLDCITKFKTPMIVINSDEDKMLDDSKLYETAKAFGEYYVPMFVNFFPNPSKYNASPEKYVEFYKKASGMFKKYASNVSLVWSVDKQNVYDSHLYYPSKQYIDWVGLSIYETSDIMGEENNKRIWKMVDYFYNMYQFDRPIMLTQFAVSHFSSLNHKYYTNEAQKQLVNTYKKIAGNYPRIKAINYMNFNNILFLPNGQAGDDFTVTSDDAMLNANRQSVAPPDFLSEISIIDTGEQVSEEFRSAVDVYTDGSQFFVSEIALDFELLVDSEQLTDEAVVIDGTTYYSLSAVADKARFVINVDDINKKLIVKIE